MTAPPSPAQQKAGRRLSPDALRVLFTEARTANGFLTERVPARLLEELAELAHIGPTSANTTPLRIVYVQSPDARARLLPALMPGNVEKTKLAPVTAILAHDLEFGAKMPRLFPQMDLTSMLADPEVAASMAHYNAALQTGYFILAARALGLDAGPMGGFDKAAVDAAFFPEGTIKTDLLVNLGYGDDEKLHARNPRLALHEVARFA
jgi:3-hydroxypropanoate dehydrogenase